MIYVNDLLLNYGKVNGSDNYSMIDVNNTIHRLNKTYDFNSIDFTISMLEEIEYDKLINQEYFHEYILNNKIKHNELIELIDDFNTVM